MNDSEKEKADEITKQFNKNGGKMMPKMYLPVFNQMVKDIAAVPYSSVSAYYIGKQHRIIDFNIEIFKNFIVDISKHLFEHGNDNLVEFRMWSLCGADDMSSLFKDYDKMKDMDIPLPEVCGKMTDVINWEKGKEVKFMTLEFSESIVRRICDFIVRESGVRLNFSDTFYYPSEYKPGDEYEKNRVIGIVFARFEHRNVSGEMTVSIVWDEDAGDVISMAEESVQCYIDANFGKSRGTEQVTCMLPEFCAKVREAHAQNKIQELWKRMKRRKMKNS